MITIKKEKKRKSRTEEKVPGEKDLPASRAILRLGEKKEKEP